MGKYRRNNLINIFRGSLERARAHGFAAHSNYLNLHKQSLGVPVFHLIQTLTALRYVHTNFIRGKMFNLARAFGPRKKGVAKIKRN